MVKKLRDRVTESDYLKAFPETILVWVISSLVPLLAIWLTGRTLNQDGFGFPEGWANSWREFFVPTEVFLYVTAIIAPSLTYMFFRWQARKHIKAYFVLLAMIIGILVFTAIVYALSKTSNQVDVEFLWSFALFVYLLALAVSYFTQVFESKLARLVGEPPPESGSGISIEPEG